MAELIPGAAVLLVRCRRCDRRLTGHLAAAAGIGAACALKELVEAADGPPGAPVGGSASEAALALVTAVLGEMPDDVVNGIVADAPGTDLPVLLAALMAFAVRETTGGPAWLRRLALTWAQQQETG